MLADFWNERLQHENEELNWGKGRELIFIITAAVLAGLVAKMPSIFSFNEDFFTHEM
ncbi:MAG: hypothetical protein ACLFUB_14620 [Cyclobacteriaceae bacterium]